MNAENRISPQAVEIEASILGAILLEKSALPKVIEIFSDPFVMYKPVHQLIYASILRLYEQNIPVDLITLTEELRGTGNLEKIGGEYYLTELTTKVSSAANIEYHAHIVLERALARQLIALSSNIVDRGYSETEDVFELIADATSMLNDVRNQTVKEHSISIKIVAKETNERVDKIHLGIDESLGFGFADIDYITGGMDKGNLVVYGGLEKRGKSILALQTMFYNAKKGIPCEFISTEMTRDDILLRYALAEEKLSWIKLKTRKFSTLELEKLKKRCL
jgi:replicative DNA helicase